MDEERKKSKRERLCVAIGSTQNSVDNLKWNFENATIWDYWKKIYGLFAIVANEWYCIYGVSSIDHPYKEHINWLSNFHENTQSYASDRMYFFTVCNININTQFISKGHITIFQMGNPLLLSIAQNAYIIISQNISLWILNATPRFHEKEKQQQQKKLPKSTNDIN